MLERFIEETFPVKEVSRQSSREKSIRYGHLSTLHIWWARRPLASSRATNYAALIPVSKNPDEKIKQRNFIIDLCKWENSLNGNILDEARQAIIESFKGKKPKILDPFAGGGTIPLEALRLGCEVYASDYNPVAVLVEKCSLEYPQKYGEKLVLDVKNWGNRLLQEVKKEIGKYYPDMPANSPVSSDQELEGIPIGYIWTRTINCSNPSCKAEIPLMRHFWLAKTSKKKVSLYPVITGKNIGFKIVGSGEKEIPSDFDPGDGTISRAIATCLICGSTVAAVDVRKQFKGGESRQKMLAVVYYKRGEKGKNYRLATREDMEDYERAEEYLKTKSVELKEKWGICPVPEETIPLMSGTFNVPLYGFNKWGDLFNSRQKLSLISFVDKVKDAYDQMLEEGYEKDYAKVVATYLALVLNRLADKNATLVVYNVVGEKIEHVFGRQALPMTWDYIELNVFSGANGDWSANLKWVLRVLEHVTRLKNTPVNVIQSSATELHYTDDYFDAVFTDPPYFNSVPYADLSDFFYVWLKRSIGNLYPDLFTSSLTPKSKELVEMTSWDKTRYAHKTREYFENNLMKAFQEIHRVLKPGGIAIIVYAHKTREGWESVINALLDSGMTITASWPISTERKARLRARKSAVLTSSVYIVARKAKRKEKCDYLELKKKMQSYLDKKLESLWLDGIAGADFFIAAIGAGIETFGK
ncbi:MAG: DUF1156 domain-containing protein [Candidatus Hodarchaeales archaeon]|jgi:adenine-specific DNA methylase